MTITRVEREAQLNPAARYLLLVLTGYRPTGSVEEATTTDAAVDAVHELMAGYNDITGTGARELPREAAAEYPPVFGPGFRHFVILQTPETTSATSLWVLWHPDGGAVMADVTHDRSVEFEVTINEICVAEGFTEMLNHAMEQHTVGVTEQYQYELTRIQRMRADIDNLLEPVADSCPVPSL